MSSVASSRHSCLWYIFLNFYIILLSLYGPSLVKVEVAMGQLVSKNLILFFRGAVCRSYKVTLLGLFMHGCIFVSPLLMNC